MERLEEIVVKVGDDLPTVLRKLVDAKATELPVVDSDFRVVGVIGLPEIVDVTMPLKEMGIVREFATLLDVEIDPLLNTLVRAIDLANDEYDVIGEDWTLSEVLAVYRPGRIVVVVDERGRLKDFLTAYKIASLLLKEIEIGMNA